MPKKTQPSDPMQTVVANITKATLGKKDIGEKRLFQRFKDMSTISHPVLSFGIKEVDEASNCGGVPRGKLVEVYGPESSGKSLLTTYLMATAQKQGHEVLLVDIEQSFDPTWASMHGLNVDTMFYGNDFTCGEEALEAAFQACKSGKFAVVVIDSTAALIPKSELEGTLDDNARVGALAQIMARGCRKLVDACAKGGTTCVFINQTRAKIGGPAWGSQEDTPGGRSLKFFAHQRIRVAKIKQLNVMEGEKKVPIGQLSIVKFIKNKTATPFGQCEFTIVFDETALNPVVMLGQALKNAKIRSNSLDLFLC